jgi:hypothetical protein
MSVWRIEMGCCGMPSLRDARNGREGCFPGEGIERDGGIMMDVLVNEWEPRKKDFDPPPMAL